MDSDTVNPSITSHATDMTNASMPSLSDDSTGITGSATEPAVESTTESATEPARPTNVNAVNPLVGIIMGSDSDLDIMSAAAKTLEEFSVPHEVRIVSAHRTPEEMSSYAAGAADRGLKIIIAGAGGSAHLPGMTASHTTLPVIAIPVKREHHGHEAFWSSIKMPPGVPLATMPENGAASGALLAVRILALSDPDLANKYTEFVRKQHDAVLEINAIIEQKGWESLLQN